MTGYFVVTTPFVRTYVTCISVLIGVIVFPYICNVSLLIHSQLTDNKSKGFPRYIPLQNAKCRNLDER